MHSDIITLTTDFGVGSRYVAAMKGVILSINPNARIVDSAHNVPAQDIRSAALLLDEAARWFPPGTIHVVVVDPGVGSDRAIIYAQFGNQHVVAPDNGLFDRLARRTSPDRMITLNNREYWLPDVSRTFHGRDIMAPVAAHLSLGVAPEKLGSDHSQLVYLDWPEVQIVPGRITGSVQSIDSFGNLITDITRDMLEDAPRDDELLVECDEHETRGIFETYADQPEMTLIALVGSGDQLELAIVNDSAQAMLGVRVGAPVLVTW